MLVLGVPCWFFSERGNCHLGPVTATLRVGDWVRGLPNSDPKPWVKGALLAAGSPRQSAPSTAAASLSPPLCCCVLDETVSHGPAYPQSQRLYLLPAIFCNHSKRRNYFCFKTLGKAARVHWNSSGETTLSHRKTKGTGSDPQR